MGNRTKPHPDHSQESDCPARLAGCYLACIATSPLCVDPVKDLFSCARLPLSVHYAEPHLITLYT